MRSVQQRIHKTLEREQVATTEIDELIKLATARLAEIDQRRKDLRVDGRMEFMSDVGRKLLLQSSPEDLVDAEREELLLEAEHRQLFALAATLRERRPEAEIAEVPAIMNAALKRLPKMISRLEKARAESASAESELRELITSLQARRGRIVYARRRTVPAIDDATFESLEHLLWTWQAPRGMDQDGLTRAASSARLALCALTAEEEADLANGDWSAQRRGLISKKRPKVIDDGPQNWYFLERDGHVIRVDASEFFHRRPQGYEAIQNKEEGYRRWKAQQRKDDVELVEPAVAMSLRAS